MVLVECSWCTVKSIIRASWALLHTCKFNFFFFFFLISLKTTSELSVHLEALIALILTPVTPVTVALWVNCFNNRQGNTCSSPTALRAHQRYSAMTSVIGYDLSVIF